MLAEIEEKIVERLEAKITTPLRIAIQEAHKSLTAPAIDVICGDGTFAKSAQKHKLMVSVYVIVTFKNLRSVKERRAGVYPIVLAIIGWLTGHDLGLAIDALTPKRMDNITEKQEANAGKIVLQLEFSTGFIIEKLADEELEDLLSVGLNYYLKPGDDVADASDEITL